MEEEEDLFAMVSEGQWGKGKERVGEGKGKGGKRSWLSETFLSLTSFFSFFFFLFPLFPSFSFKAAEEGCLSSYIKALVTSDLSKEYYRPTAILRQEDKVHNFFYYFYCFLLLFFFYRYKYNKT